MSVNQEALRTVAKSINKFSLAYFKMLSEDNPNVNIICSPLSTALVLTMVTYGARERTEKQLRSTLHLSNDTNTKDSFQSLINTLNNFKSVELQLANNIFMANGFNLQTEFENLLKIVFGSKSEYFDPKKSEEASKAINLWCEQKTSNRIKNIVEPDDLKNAVLVLINAVYFKGDWALKFDSNLTKSQPFYIDENTIKEVPIMYKHDKFNFGYVEELNAQFVELPYQNDDAQDSISMFVILPDEPKVLKHIEANLDKLDFAKLRGPARKIVLQLPKFKIECKFDLEKILQKMGVTDIFENTANFGGISNTSPLKVSKIIQKAFIEVNEEGSEAVAVTGIQMMPMSMPISFVVNRPFIFVIVANHTEVQLFNARVIDPTSN